MSSRNVSAHRLAALFCHVDSSTSTSAVSARRPGWARAGPDDLRPRAVAPSRRGRSTGAVRRRCPTSVHELVGRTGTAAQFAIVAEPSSIVAAADQGDRDADGDDQRVATTPPAISQRSPAPPRGGARSSSLEPPDQIVDVLVPRRVTHAHRLPAQRGRARPRAAGRACGSSASSTSTGTTRHARSLSAELTSRRTKSSGRSIRRRPSASCWSSHDGPITTSIGVARRRSTASTRSAKS